MYLPLMAPSEEVVADYQTHHLSLRDHPMRFLRPVFERRGARPCVALRDQRDRARFAVAGVVLVRQRPGGGKVCFITLEDETGVANLVVLPKVLATFRKEIMSARLILAEGRVQRAPEGVTHLLCQHIHDFSADLLTLSAPEDQGLEPPLSRADEVAHAPPPPRLGHPRQVRILPKSRDFH